MRILFSRSYFWIILCSAIFVGLGSFFYYTIIYKNTPQGDTAVVTRGDVAVSVRVSGKVEAEQSAELSFPIIGTVQNVYRDDGDSVTMGEILASVTQSASVASYNTALQNVRYYESLREELMGGPQSETRKVTATNVAIAEENVSRVTNEHAQIVASAREAYVSSDLEALPSSKTNNDVPPIISGNYNCADEGTYTISIFNSNSPTGYSYKLSGLEDGTYTVYTHTSAALGSCGLLIQFNSDEYYRSTVWTVTIPNVNSATYLTNKNAYILALQQQKNAIEAATQALNLAKEKERAENAPPTDYELEQANARIEEARAGLALQEARIADYIIKAPFDGTITESDLKIGEVADISRSMTIIKEGAYELTARIPEVDITKIRIGQSAQVFFDAAPHTPLLATLSYIAPAATDIDGVAYYKSHFTLTETPEWLRAGLNADVRIIVDEKKNVLTIPKRFVHTDGDISSVFIGPASAPKQQRIQLGLTGNDGAVEVIDITEGTTVIAP